MVIKIIIFGLIFAQTINGYSNLSNAEYDSLNVNGTLVFKALSVKDLLVVNGSIQGKDLQCKSLKSNGSLEINGLNAREVESKGSFTGNNVFIAEKAVFNGSLEINNGKMRDVEIANTNSCLTNTEVSGNIVIKKLCPPSSELQILELKGNSIVAGDVAFETAGEVHIFDDAKINGKVVNAKVIQH